MTPREGQYRRASDMPWYWQLTHFLGAPIVDHWRGISLTRLIAAFCCLAVAQDTFIHAKQLSWVDFCVLALSVATAFGRWTYEAFLKRLTMGVNTSSSSTTTTTATEVTASNTEGA